MHILHVLPMRREPITSMTMRLLTRQRDDSLSHTWELLLRVMRLLALLDRPRDGLVALAIDFGLEVDVDELCVSGCLDVRGLGGMIKTAGKPMNAWPGW